MKYIIQKLFLCYFILLRPCCISAQEKWPTPELSQMFRHAEEYTAMGNLKDAITTYKNALVLVPGKIALYKGLGKALFLNGDYKESENMLKVVVKSSEADAASYRLLALDQAAQDNIRQAKLTLQKGISLFPTYGSLYHEQGNLYVSEKKTKSAFNAWIDGIKHDPQYSRNYYDVALAYLNTDDVLPGTLYGELYLALEQDTTGTEAFKQTLFNGYKTLFANLSAGASPKNREPVSFIEAIKETYRSLTPVISDGITTENLTMIRARFVMDWFSTYAPKYPFTLFSYQDELIRSGHYDIYNEWLFGAAESPVEYEAWNKFHEGDINRFRQWQAEHPIQPAASDFSDLQ